MGKKKEQKKRKNKPRNPGLRSSVGSFPSGRLRASPGSRPGMLQNPTPRRRAPLSAAAHCKYPRPNAQKGISGKELEQNPFPNAREELEELHPLPQGPLVLLESVGAGRAGSGGDGGGGRRVMAAGPSSSTLPNPSCNELLTSGSAFKSGCRQKNPPTASQFNGRGSETGAPSGDGSTGPWDSAPRLRGAEAEDGTCAGRVLLCLGN